MFNKIAPLFACLFAFSAHAADCSKEFAGGAAPQLINQRLTKDSQQLCFDAYAVLHSGATHTPLWSAEYLTPARIESARGVKRVNTFHPEARLAVGTRSELADYVRSGYDRGHMSPSGDMPSATAQHESFSLSNMIPQDPDNNENLWEGIESATRDLAVRQSGAYVVTGPIFEGSSLKQLHGRVFVPTFIFKAVYVPSLGQAAAYITPNAPGMKYETVSIADLEKRIGINVFPTVSDHIKHAKMALPEPTPHGFGEKRGQHRVASQAHSHLSIGQGIRLVKWLSH